MLKPNGRSYVIITLDHHTFLKICVWTWKGPADQFFSPFFRLGYSGHFIKRTLDYFDEGEATFVKTARFSVESWAGVSLMELMKKAKYFNLPVSISARLDPHKILTFRFKRFFKNKNKNKSKKNPLKTGPFLFQSIIDIKGAFRRFLRFFINKLFN